MLENTALIWMTTYLMGGSARLLAFVTALQAHGQVLNSSSIYKQYFSERSEDLNSNLVLCVKIRTELLPEELFQLLRELEAGQGTVPGMKKDNLLLLTYDRLIRLVPGQNLPNPKLHTDPLTLQCAAEAWGDYIHPVLGQSLLDLVRYSDPVQHVEFFAQGRSLVSTETE